jgi:hypothetical protein
MKEGDSIPAVIHHQIPVYVTADEFHGADFTASFDDLVGAGQQ